MSKSIRKALKEIASTALGGEQRELRHVVMRGISALYAAHHEAAYQHYRNASIAVRYVAVAGISSGNNVVPGNKDLALLLAGKLTDTIGGEPIHHFNMPVGYPIGSVSRTGQVLLQLLHARWDKEHQHVELIAGEQVLAEKGEFITIPCFDSEWMVKTILG